MADSACLVDFRDRKIQHIYFIRSPWFGQPNVMILPSFNWLDWIICYWIDKSKQLIVICCRLESKDYNCIVKHTFYLLKKNTNVPLSPVFQVLKYCSQPSQSKYILIMPLKANTLVPKIHPINVFYGSNNKTLDIWTRRLIVV